MTDGLPPDELLTTGEAARLLGCSRQHIVDLCNRGDLQSIRVGAHRRLRLSDVERLLAGSLTRDQERSLWLHRAVAGRVVMNPDDAISRARRNIERLRDVHPTDMASKYLERWRAMIDGDLDHLLDMLTSRNPYAIELRQNSPFAGVLSEDERQACLATFREHWRRDHAA